tara:strand:+ start:241 stop:441 length:201 start_codon:yes stop_codon:yes gene_type:complete
MNTITFKFKNGLNAVAVYEKLLKYKQLELVEPINNEVMSLKECANDETGFVFEVGHAKSVSNALRL